MVDLRTALTGVYTAEKLAELGFARRTPQLPEELSEQASSLGLDLQARENGRKELATFADLPP